MKPIYQKYWIFAWEKHQALNERDKLLKTRSIWEVDYPEWLANMIVVRKVNGKWRTCVDFTDLNKACPKDYFLLPDIDQMVNVIARYYYLSSFNVYSEYHHIKICQANKKKTSFIIDKNTYYYQAMSFGLMNTWATYQHLVNKM